MQKTTLKAALLALCAITIVVIFCEQSLQTERIFILYLDATANRSLRSSNSLMMEGSDDLAYVNACSLWNASTVHSNRYEHPSIVHYVKLSAKSSKPVNLTYMEHLSIMSAYKFLKPESIIVHSNSGITGKYWDILQTWHGTTIEAKLVQRVNLINHRSVKTIEHEADYIKLNALLTFGGLISDFDVLIVNGEKLKSLQGLSECVLSKEGNDYINIGFLSCIPNSSYIQDWLHLYNFDYQDVWTYNSGIVPMKILMNSTDYQQHTCLVDGIATNPGWNYTNAWLAEEGVNWQSKVAAHFFDREMKASDETVLSGNHSFADMISFIVSA